mmetsp:Transcript_40879/g.65644  ORF Transcript_40879/g.65644 Transcript_40879/m.65644 type:complete len:321 (-) Transcript_40879:46-1008(-)
MRINRDHWWTGSAIVGLIKVCGSSLKSCPPSLSKQKIENGGNFNATTVDDARQFLSILPLLFAGQLFFMVAYSQMSTYAMYQGFEMKAEGFLKSNVLNSLANPIFVILGAAVLDKVLYPFLRKKNMEPNHMTKFQIACGFGVAAMLYGIGLDYLIKSNWTPENGGTSILALIPMYALIAFGEIFANPVALDLAFHVSPGSTKAIAIGIQSLAAGALPNALSAIISGAASGFQTDKYGCKSRNDQTCDSPYHVNGKKVWDYKSVNFQFMYLIFMVFPCVGLVTVQLARGYYRKVLATKYENDTRTRDQEAMVFPSSAKLIQ